MKSTVINSQKNKKLLKKNVSPYKPKLSLAVIVLIIVVSIAANKASLINGASRTNINSYAALTKTVVIDAGHGGYDGGAIGYNKTLEKNNTLAVALKLGNLLQSQGIKVVYTRKSDKVSWTSNVINDLQARVKISDDANASLFISIHNNSSTDKNVNGVETYYFAKSNNGKNLANFIHSSIVNQLKVNDRGTRTSDYYVLRNTKTTAVLVELGYITNKNEEYMLSNSNYESKYAEAIKAGIIKYLYRSH